MNQLSEERKKLIVEYLTEHLKCETIILFGSATRGALREDSDIDISYLSDQQNSHYERFMIAQGLAMLLKMDVDLINFDLASSVFKVQILSNYEILYDQNSVRKDYAFMRALKEYALLNEERAVILR